MFGILSRSQGDGQCVEVKNNNQEMHDTCVAVKDSASTSNRKRSVSAKLVNKDNPSVQGSSPGKDVSSNIVKTVQHDKVQDDAAFIDEMLHERIQSAKKHSENKGKFPNNTTLDSYSS